MKISKIVTNVLAAVGLLSASVAGATVYSWSGTNSGGTMGAGGIGGTSDPLQTMSIWYDTATQNLGITAKWTTSSADGAPEGAWLVLSDGAMPKALPDEVPIYYIDWSTGTNRIVSYSYDGSVSNGGGQYFGSIDNAVQVTNGTGTQQISFTINLANVNSYTTTAWKGGDFASNVGVWFHWFDQTTTNKISYGGAPGAYTITALNNPNESWYDTGGTGNTTTSCSTVPGTPGYSSTCAPTTDKPCGTTGGTSGFGGCGGGGGSVPAPAVPLLIAVGLIGLGVTQRASLKLKRAKSKAVLH